MLSVSFQFSRFWGNMVLVPLHTSAMVTLLGGTDHLCTELSHRWVKSTIFLLLLLLLWLTMVTEAIISSNVLSWFISFICSPSCTQVAFQIYCDIVRAYTHKEMRYKSLTPNLAQSLQQSVRGSDKRYIHWCALF